MTEHRAMNKPRPYAKPLREIVGKVVSQSFVRQGFASAELVTRWTEIVGLEVAAHSEPIKIQWLRPVSSPRAPGRTTAADIIEQEPGTLVLRVEGPAAIEIQHLVNVICERVNRFLGWRAVARISLRQAPLRRRQRQNPRACDPAELERLAQTLSAIEDDTLREALARLGAAIKAG